MSVTFVGECEQSLAGNVAQLLLLEWTVSFVTLCFLCCCTCIGRCGVCSPDVAGAVWQHGERAVYPRAHSRQTDVSHRPPSGQVAQSVQQVRWPAV